MRRMISLVPIASALSKMISARQACFWAAFRSRTKASSRRRSKADTVMEIPVRIAQNRTRLAKRESQKGLFRQISSTSEGLAVPPFEGITFKIRR